MRSARQPNEVRAAAVSLNEQRSPARTPQQALPSNPTHPGTQKTRGPNIRDCVLDYTPTGPPAGRGGGAAVVGSGLGLEWFRALAFLPRPVASRRSAGAWWYSRPPPLRSRRWAVVLEPSRGRGRSARRGAPAGQHRRARRRGSMCTGPAISSRRERSRRASTMPRPPSTLPQDRRNEVRVG
jgi:hypothetical protein